MPSVTLLLKIARVTFFAALIFTLYNALMPAHHVLHLMPWDKAEHFLAFYGLTGLAVAAFPRARLWVVALWLSALGAAIEVVQGLSFVHRDRDFWDWVADSLAIIAALAPMILVWWRAQFKKA